MEAISELDALVAKGTNISIIIEMTAKSIPRSNTGSGLVHYSFI